MYNQDELKNLVDQSITQLSYDTEAGNLIDPVRYILSIGGKRLRPVLALMACNLFSDRIDDAVMPAIGLEIFHNFTLVHDDIMDQAPVRRNLPTVHTKWNINQAVLSGDVMAFIANDCFLHTPSAYLTEVFRVFNKAAIEVCIGQQLDFDYEKAGMVSQDEYLRMIELKTAILIAASVKIGALIGGAGEKDAALLFEFGRNLGMAFQIQDDLLDIYGDSKIFGKIPGGDIIANKKTFLLVKAMESASHEQLMQLQQLFSTKDTEPDKKIKMVMKIYDHLNIRMLTEKLASDYIATAFISLDMVTINRHRKEEITQLAKSLIGRVS
jgi:geranylgeranyl diphosphate synthase, type II